MIEVTATPANRHHFDRLLAFAKDVLAISDELGIEPILDSSLAIFAYTQDPSLEVHDVDFGCPEADFPQLQAALEDCGVECRLKPWHVLQAHRDGLKIDFGAVEHWNQDLPEGSEHARFGDVTFRMLSLDALCEQYRRGLADTKGKSDPSDVYKYTTYTEKLRLLDMVNEG